MQRPRGKRKFGLLREFGEYQWVRASIVKESGAMSKILDSVLKAMGN